MSNTNILITIIENLRANKFAEAQQDCTLLPKCKETTQLYATIGAIDGQPTEQSFKGTKSAAIALADSLIGRI